MTPEVTIRSFVEEDREYYQEWLAHDETHRARYGEHGEKFLDGIIWTVSSDGKPVAFLRLTQVMRVEAQFPPQCERPVVKFGRILRRGLFKLAALLKHFGYKEIVFESNSDGRLRTFMKGLGFAESDYLQIPLERK